MTESRNVDSKIESRSFFYTIYMLQKVPVGHCGGGESGAQRLHPAARHHHPHEPHRPDRCHALRPLRELPLQTDGEASPGQGRSVSRFYYFPKEIIDHRDNQGREKMNLKISKAANFHTPKTEL